MWFDSKFYRDVYKDLPREWDQRALANHYVNFGYTERRLPSLKLFQTLYPDFCWKIYNNKHKTNYTENECILNFYSNPGSLTIPGNKVLIIRIIGNNLPGLHGDDQGYINLKYTLENEKIPFDSLYILNRIVDLDRQDKLQKLLDKHYKKYIILPFDFNTFNKLKTEKSQINYIINNNPGRNFALKKGKELKYTWVAPFDSNQFITPDLVNEIKHKIKQPHVKYIAIPQRRINEENYTNKDLPGCLNKLKKTFEHQLMFRYDAKEIFNEAIPYGKSPKAELLQYLNVRLNGDDIYQCWVNVYKQHTKRPYRSGKSIEQYVCTTSKNHIIRLSPHNIKNSIGANINLRAKGIIRLMDIVPKQTEKYKTFNKIYICVPYCSIFKPHITECIQSIHSQRYSNYEIIIINDGSNDREFLKSLGKNIKIVNKSRNGGPAASKASLVEYFKANKNLVNINDIAVVVDGDDKLLPGALDTINHTYNTDKCWMTVGNYTGKFSENILKAGIQYEKNENWNSMRGREWGAPHPRSYKIFLLCNLVSSDFKYNNDWVKKSTDTIMVVNSLELCGNNKVSLIKKPIYFYREHPLNTYNTITSNYKEQITTYIAESEPKKSLNEPIHMIMCCWKRLHSLRHQIKNISTQASQIKNPIYLHLINNNVDERIKITNIVNQAQGQYRNINIILSHYENVYSVFERFMYIRDIIIKKYIADYVIIIDDDQLFPDGWIKNLWDKRAPKQFTGWYCKLFRNNGIPGKVNYWNDSKITWRDCSRTEKAETDTSPNYMGPGGSIIDVSIFSPTSNIWTFPNDIPPGIDIYHIDDIWLSYICYTNSYSLNRSFLPVDRSLEIEERKHEESDFNGTKNCMWMNLNEPKLNFLRYLDIKDPYWLQ